MATTSLPSTSSYYRRQHRLQALVVGGVVQEWRRMEPRGTTWAEQFFDDIGPRVLTLLLAAQTSTTRTADAYIPQVLAEQDLDGDGPTVPSDAFVGNAGDGRPVSTLLQQSLTVAAVSYDRSLDPDAAGTAALGVAERWLAKVATTLLGDTARATESSASASRFQVDGYVRMLTPPSCSRCAILAGRFYGWSTGFQRHPRCDCRHIPSSEAVAGDLTVSPGAYFDSLSPTEQDRLFTKDGAQAIRDGGDMGQVVNARRGMSTAQIDPLTGTSKGRLVTREVFGRQAFITTEGTTRRGLAYRALNERFRNQSTDVRAFGERYFRTTNVRLMPESIYKIAGQDRAEAIRLLRLHGYIT